MDNKNHLAGIHGEPNASRDLTVLIIGDAQSGKSTLINHLAEFHGSGKKMEVMADVSKSVSRPQFYDFEVTSKHFRIYNKKTKKEVSQIDPSSVGTVVQDFINERLTISEVPASENSPAFKLHLLDTPGISNLAVSALANQVEPVGSATPAKSVAPVESAASVGRQSRVMEWYHPSQSSVVIGTDGPVGVSDLVGTGSLVGTSGLIGASGFTGTGGLVGGPVEANAFDDDQLISVLRTLQERETLNAVWFVCNSNDLYSGNFQRNYGYYKSMLPDLADKLVIVHTRLSVSDLELNPDFMKERIKQFQTTIDTDPRIKHFFVNAFWKSNRYELLEFALNSLAVSSLLQHSSSLPTQKIATIGLLKSQRIKSLDPKLSQMAQRRIETFVDGLKQFSLGRGQAHGSIIKADTQNPDEDADPSSGNIVQRVAKAAISEARGTSTGGKTVLDNARERLAAIDNDHLVRVGSKSATEVHGSLLAPYQDETLEINSLYPIMSVEKNLGDRNCYWSGEPEYSSDRKQVRQKIQSQLCGGLSGTIIAYTHSNIYHASEIAKLKEVAKYEDYINSCVFVRDLFASGTMPLAQYLELKDVYDAEIKRGDEKIDQGHDIEVINAILSKFNKPTIVAAC